MASNFHEKKDLKNHLGGRTPVRVLGWGVFSIVVMIIATSIIAISQRNILLEFVINRELSEYGIKDTSFTVEHLEASTARIKNVKIGNQVFVESIEVSYSLSGLKQGHIERIDAVGLAVDVSEPESGILGIAMNVLASKGSTPSLPLPKVRISDANFYGTRNSTSFTANINGEMASDFSGVFQIAGEGSFEVFGHTLKADVLSADIVLEADMVGVVVTLDKGTVADVSATPWFHPLESDGTAIYGDDTLILNAVMSTADGRGLLRLKAIHALDGNQGSAKLSLEPLEFKPGAFSPEDLSPLAGDFGDVSGKVKGGAKLSWSKGAIQGNGNATFSSVSFIANGVCVSNLSTVLNLSTLGNLDRLEIKARNGRASIAAEGGSMNISDAEVSLEGGFGEVNFYLFKAMISDGAEKPRFVPLDLEGKGKLSGSELSFHIKALAAGNKASIVAKGSHHLETRSGGAEIFLSPLTFTSAGLQLGDLFPDALNSDTVSGIVEGLADISWDDKGLVGKVNAAVKGASYTVGDIIVKELSANLNVSSLRPGATISVDLDKVRASLGVAGLHFRLAAEAVITVDPQSGKVAVRLNSGTLEHDNSNPLFAPAALSGRVDLSGNKLAFSGTASILRRADGSGNILVKGQHHLVKKEGEAFVTFSPLVFDHLGPTPGDLSALLSPIKLAIGTVEGKSHVFWTASNYDGTADLIANGLSFAVGTTWVEQFSSVLHLDRLNPLTMDKVQEITAARIIDAVSMVKPIVRFRIVEGRHVYIDHAEVGIAGGLVSVDGIVVDNISSAKRFTLKLSALDLEKFLKLLDMEGVSGTGIINGSVPLEIKDNMILVDDGLLTAEGPGALRVRSKEAQRTLAGGGEQVELLRQVLEDFHYKRLSLMLEKGENTKARIRLHTEGTNPAVKNGHPFILNINLSGNLDNVLALVMEAYRLSDRALGMAVGDGLHQD